LALIFAFSRERRWCTFGSGNPFSNLTLPKKNSTAVSYSDADLVMVNSPSLLVEGSKFSLPAWLSALKVSDSTKIFCKLRR